MSTIPLFGAAWALIISVGISCAAPPAARPEPEHARVRGDLGYRLNEYVERAAAGGFSGQVLVARGGEVLLDGAYGWADRAKRMPMTKQTPIGIASVSKQFTAAAILSLIETGRISLTDTLGHFFPDAPADKRSITVRMLITHTSGIAGGFSDDFDQRSLEGSITRLLNRPLDFEPGTSFRYSSDAYNLLAAVVQQVSGMSFERYVVEHLLVPAGMHNSGYAAMGAEAGAARAYVGWSDRGSPEEWPRNWRSFGGGDLLSTASDIHAWHVAVRAGRILDSATVDTFLAPLVALPEGSASYGFGLFHDESETVGPFVEHGGDTELGYNASYFHYTDSDVVIVILANARTHAGVSVRHLLGAPLETMALGDTVAPLPPLSPLSEASLRSLVGSYALPDGGRLDLISDGALLWAAGASRTALNLLGRDTLDAVLAERAEARTRLLVDSLIESGTGAFASALGSDGAPYLEDYANEWRALVAARGAVHRHGIAGSRLIDDAVLVLVHLKFRASDAHMTFRWLERGAGRLSGTNPDAAQYLAAHPVASEDGGLVAWDGLRERMLFRMRPVGDGMLDIEDESGRMRTLRVSRAGWHP